MDKKLELTRKCLTLISRIASRGAASPDPEHAQDTLMELHYTQLTSPYEEETAHKDIRDLERLHQELDFIDSSSQEFTAYDVLKFATWNTWN